MKILAVMDDSKGIARLEALKHLGHHLRSVGDPEVAPMELVNPDYDLILCQMPLNNGITAFDLLTMLRLTSLDKKIPFVCCSVTVSKLEKLIEDELAPILPLMGAHGYVNYQTYYSEELLSIIDNYAAAPMPEAVSTQQI